MQYDKVSMAMKWVEQQNKTKWDQKMEPQIELDGDQHGYIAKYGSFTSGVLQLSSTTRGSRPEI